MPEPAVDQATGVLTLAYRTTPTDALERLVNAAQRNGINLLLLCEAVVTAASGGIAGKVFADLIDREWGDAPTVLSEPDGDVALCRCFVRRRIVEG